MRITRKKERRKEKDKRDKGNLRLTPAAKSRKIKSAEEVPTASVCRGDNAKYSNREGLGLGWGVEGTADSRTSGKRCGISLFSIDSQIG